MLLNLITLLIFGFTQAHSVVTCPTLADDIYFVGNPVDFNYIENCTRLNSSLFITGDYNINDLSSLKNLETIEGYLVILDSHLIRNLRGMHNIHEVKGNELYLKTASITFKYNNNFLDDENRGLCFTDLVNWTKITSHSVVDTNNGINCPDECHPECVGCFGPGPRLCQECRHAKIGNTCVNYDCDKNDCSLVETGKKLTLSLKRVGLQDLNITWPQLNISESRGNIQSYRLYRDGNLIYNNYFDDSGYTTKDYLPTSMIDFNLTLNMYHFYRIEYQTEKETISSDEFHYNMYDWTPDSIRNLQVLEHEIINPLSMNTRVSFESKTNGVPYRFIFTLFEDSIMVFQNRFLEVDSLDKYNEVRLTELSYVTFYQLEVCGYNSEYNIMGACSVLDFTTPQAPTITSTTQTSTTISTTSKTTKTQTTITTSTTSTQTSTTSTQTSTTSTQTSTTSTQTSTTGTQTSTTGTQTSTTGTQTSTTGTATTLTGTATTLTGTATTLTGTTVTGTSSSITHQTINISNNNNFIGIKTNEPSKHTFRSQTSVTTTLEPDSNKYSITPTTFKEKTTPEILNIININNFTTNFTDNKTILREDYNGKKGIPIWTIILIVILILFLIICILCCFSHSYLNNNEVCPEKPKPGFQNPVYQHDTVDVTQEFQYDQAKPGLTRTPNPIYNSGSSISSNEVTHESRKTHDYAVVGRQIIQNGIYASPDSGPATACNTRGVIKNETYGFPEEELAKVDTHVVDSSSADENENQYDYCVEENIQNRTVRPSSAYQAINRRRNSQEFTIKPGLKNYRPTLRKDNKDITDESISRRKGNLMSELQKNLQGRQNSHFDI